MNIPSRRKLAAAALIIAGLSAFLVPFLLHGPNTQGTGAPNGGNNGGGNSGTCTDNSSSDPAHSSGKGHGQAGNHGKHKGLTKSLADSVQHMLDKMGRHNPAFHEHNSTRTDNDVDSNHGHHDSPPGDQDSSCTGDKEDQDN